MSDAVQRLFHRVPVEVMPRACQTKGLLGGTRRDAGIRLPFLSKVAYLLLALLLEGDTKQRLVMTDHKTWSLVQWSDCQMSSLSCHKQFSP